MFEKFSTQLLNWEIDIVDLMRLSRMAKSYIDDIFTKVFYEKFW